MTSMDKDGIWSWYDIDIIKKVAQSVSIPVIANGGAGNLQHLWQAVHQGGASAIALGSMVVYQQKGLGVLVNFPEKNELEKLLEK